MQPSWRSDGAANQSVVRQHFDPRRFEWKYSLWINSLRGVLILLSPFHGSHVCCRCRGVQSVWRKKRIDIFYSSGWVSNYTIYFPSQGNFSNRTEKKTLCCCVRSEEWCNSKAFEKMQLTKNKSRLLLNWITLHRGWLRQYLAVQHFRFFFLQPF